MKNFFSTFLKDFVGVIIRPGKTLGEVTEKKRFAAVFILIMVVALVYSYLMIPHQVDRMSQNPDISEEQLLLLKNNTPGTRLMGGSVAAFMVFLNICVGTFFVFLFYGIGGVDGTYSELFALVTNASIIDTLIPQLIGAVFILVSGTLTALPTAAVFFPELEAYSFSRLALSRVEFFSLWYIVALSAGAAAFGRITLKKSLLIGLIYYLFKTLMLVSFSYIFLNVFKS